MNTIVYLKTENRNASRVRVIDCPELDPIPLFLTSAAIASGHECDKWYHIQKSSVRLRYLLPMIPCWLICLLGASARSAAIHSESSVLAPPTDPQSAAALHIDG